MIRTVELNIRSLHQTSRHQIVERAPIARKRNAAAIDQHIVDTDVWNMDLRSTEQEAQARAPERQPRAVLVRHH
jgi:hypothetical protein